MPRYKVLIAEIDGTELGLHEELDLNGTNVYFEDPEFVATTVSGAISEAKNNAVGFAEFESFGSDLQESTTSNNWVTKSGFPYTTDNKTAGTYIIDYTAELGQSDKFKQVGFRVQWREGTTGSWLDLTDIRAGLPTDGEFQIRTGFRQVQLTSDGVFQVRIQFGQTDDGGTGFIQNCNIKIGRVEE